MRITGALRVAVVCTAALSSVLSFASIAQAAPDLSVGLTEAIARDLKISPQEYLDRAARAQRLASYATNFRAARPADFAGAWIGPDGKAVIAVTNMDAAKAVAQDGYETRQAAVSADGLEKSLADLNGWISSLPREISRQINATSIDMLNNQVTIDIVNSPLGQALNLPTLLANIKVILAPGGAAPVDPSAMSGDTYVTTLGPIAQSAHAEITMCSFGFNAIDKSGKSVNLTAGHCNPQSSSGAGGSPVYLPNNANIDASTQVGQFRLSSIGQASGLDYSVIDVNAAGISAGLDRPTIRGANGSTLTITGTAQPVVGAPVCKSGQSSSFTCGVVAADRVETQLYMTDGTSRLVRGFASTACTLAGDSGGAIVTGTLALGITSGSNSDAAPDCGQANIALAPYGGTASLGIPIQQIADATGTAIRINPS